MEFSEFLGLGTSAEVGGISEKGTVYGQQLGALAEAYLSAAALGDGEPIMVGDLGDKKVCIHWSKVQARTTEKKRTAPRTR